MNAATLFAGLVGITIVGWLWFYIARPLLEDFGVITVSDYGEDDGALMSRAEDSAPASPRPSLETGNQTDRQTEIAPRIKAEELLTVFKLMRAAGIGREDAAAAFKAAGLPFNNNVWRDAEPPARAVEDEFVTPYAGRRTKASYYPEQPELEYQAP